MRNHPFLSSGVYGFLGLLAIACAGCGGSAPVLAPASGKVTLEGQPLATGTVNFESTTQGFMAAGVLQPDGSYNVTSQHGNGLPVGTYKVSISPPSRDQPKPGEKSPPISSPIPQRYRTSAASGLTAEVQSGGGPYNFDLKK